MNLSFLSTSVLSSANALNLDWSKILLFDRVDLLTVGELTLPNEKKISTDKMQSICMQQIQCCLLNCISCLYRVENIVGKGKNAAYQHCHNLCPYPTMF